MIWRPAKHAGQNVAAVCVLSSLLLGAALQPQAKGGVCEPWSACPLDFECSCDDQGRTIQGYQDLDDDGRPEQSITCVWDPDQTRRCVTKVDDDGDGNLERIECVQDGPANHDLTTAVASDRDDDGRVDEVSFAVLAAAFGTQASESYSYDDDGLLVRASLQHNYAGAVTCEAVPPCPPPHALTPDVCDLEREIARVPFDFGHCVWACTDE